MAGLDRAVDDPLRVGNDRQRLFCGGAQGEVVLEQTSQQLPAPTLQLVFELSVGQRRRLVALQPGQHLFEAHA